MPSSRPDNPEGRERAHRAYKRYENLALRPYRERGPIRGFAGLLGVSALDQALRTETSNTWIVSGYTIEKTKDGDRLYWVNAKARDGSEEAGWYSWPDFGRWIRNRQLFGQIPYPATTETMVATSDEVGRYASVPTQREARSAAAEDEASLLSLFFRTNPWADPF